MRTGCLILATLAATVLPMPVLAEIYYDEVPVIDAEPIYEARQVPVQGEQCGYEQPTSPPPVNPAALGDARVADPGTNLLGALNRDVALRQPPAPEYRCRTVTRMESQQTLAGYRVRYEYHGKVYEQRMAAHPGDRLKIAVQLRPGTGYSRYARHR